jgi:hypothetical protein
MRGCMHAPAVWKHQFYRTLWTGKHLLLRKWLLCEVYYSKLYNP